MPVDENVDLAQRKGSKRYQAVFTAISSAIREGKFQAGSRLPAERELAKEFGVGRNAIREAMVALEIHGFVEIKHGAGLFIVCSRASMQGGELEIIAARRMCEGEAAALAAATITDVHLAKIAKLLREIEADAKLEAAGEATYSFHLAIAQATDNSAIIHVVANLLEMHRRSGSCREIYDRSCATGWYQAYLGIYRALRARDPAAARSAVHEHFDRVIEQAAQAESIEGRGQLSLDAERNARIAEPVSRLRRTAG